MSSKQVLICTILALAIAGFYQLVSNGKSQFPEYQVSVGQIADFDLVAPFDFPVLKPDAQLEQEYEQVLISMGKPYSRDSNVEFEAYINLNKLFDLLFASSEAKDWENLKVSAQRLGFQLSDSVRPMLADPQRVVSAYDAIKDALGDVYAVGIYSNINADSILVVNDKVRRRQNLSSYFQIEQAKRSFIDKLNGLSGILARDNVDQLVRPNLLVNEAKYKELMKSVREGLNPVAGIVSQNEIIVSRNQRLSEDQINKLHSLTLEYQNRGMGRASLLQWLSVMGLLFYVFSILLAFNGYLGRQDSKSVQGQPGFVSLNLALLGLVLLTVLTKNILKLDPGLIPFAMFALAIAILSSLDLAVIFSICGALLISPFLNWEVHNLALLLLSTLLALVLMHRLKAHYEYFKIWMFLFASLNVVMIALTLYSYTGNDITEKAGPLLRNVGYSLISTAVSILGCVAIVTFYEKRWNRATKQVLLELLDFNHPLLKRLATSAEGTYHHSLIVGNLAERAAEAIGANSLLARVGSYYHDIGKVMAPEVFTENNEVSDEVHSHYTPEESAELIRNHVREGVVLANKHQIPQAVTDIILQHHGRSLIRFFLDAALRSGEEVDQENFRYTGPLPQSKEAALVMLADVVESTTKSKSPGSEEEIVKTIDETIQRLLREGQFDEAPITIKELAEARDAMAPILAGIYRKRLEYPEARPV